MTSLGSQALAVPGDGMSREQTTSQVDLPDIPESTALADDASADKALSLGDEQQVVPYAPENVAPWAEDAGEGAADGADPAGHHGPGRERDDVE